MICDICKTEGHIKITLVKIGQFACSDCYVQPAKSNGIRVVQTIYLGKERMKTTQARLNELKRRVILPVEPTNGDNYCLGRRGENGKIQEREPTY